MLEKLTKLMDVKSLVTLAMTIVFSVLCLRGSVSPEQFLTVYTVVISFYFSVQFQKYKNGKNQSLQMNERSDE